MTEHNTQKTETAMFSEGFEPEIPPSELSETHALANEANDAVFYVLNLH
jgi:hypothetical protein